MGSLPTGISGSRGSAVLGLNKYKTPLVAWLEIMEQLEPGFCFKNGYESVLRIDPWETPLNPKHAPLRFGLAFEDAICDLSGDITDREAEFQHPEYPWMTCHIDGLKNGALVENKTAFDMAFKKNWGQPGTDQIPKEYMIQVQHNMLLTGCKTALVNVLVFPKTPAEWEKMGYRVDMTGDIWTPQKQYMSTRNFSENIFNLGYFHQYHIEADPDLQQDILNRYLDFWNNNVLKQVPPPIQGYDDIKYLIASPKGEIEATEEMLSLWSEKSDIENEVADMLDRADKCKINFAKLLQIEIQNKNIKPGAEDKKLEIFSGSLKLGTISRISTYNKISPKMVDKCKEDFPDLYGEMKKINFLDLMSEEIELTEKQKEKVESLETAINHIDLQVENGALVEDFQGLISDLSKEQAKILKSLKLTKLLSKDSIVKTLQKQKPEIFKLFYETGIIEEVEGKSSLKMTSNKE